MKVLVTGGAGYIGSIQTKLLLDQGYDVVVYDNLNTGHREMVDARATFIKGDVRDIELVTKTLIEYDIDIVIHFAALSLVGESVEQPLKYYDNNVNGFEKLLTALQKAKVDKIIFSSTAAVYGNHEKMPITEDFLKKPLNPYGETKLVMERMIEWTAQTSEINYVILRYFNVAGASLDAQYGELHNPETHLIPIALEVARNQREYLALYGDDYPTPDGTCIRDYIHVEDLCQAHIKALEYLDKGNKSDVFNLGYEQGFSVKQIIDAVNRVTNKDIPVKVEPRRAGDPALLIASSSKAQEILEWKPQYNDIDLIIKTAYDFYNQQGIK